MGYAGDEARVYVDVLLLVNFVMDYFILWAAGRLANIKVKKKRLVLGALLGGVYSLVIFFPDNTFLNSWSVKICCSLLMVASVFCPLKIMAFSQIVLNVYLVSFAMGGAVIAGTYLLDDAPGFIQVLNGVAAFRGNIYFGRLVAGLIVALVIGYGGWFYMRKLKLSKNLINTVTIILQGKKIEVKGLLDTGNQLKEPLTNYPVLILESRQLQDCLPLNLFQAIKQDSLQLTELTAGMEPEWVSRLRLIPFSSVGKNYGVLAGIRPDWVEVVSPEGIYRGNEVVIGLINRPLCREGKYQALLPMAIFE